MNAKLIKSCKDCKDTDTCEYCHLNNPDVYDAKITLEPEVIKRIYKLYRFGEYADFLQFLSEYEGDDHWHSCHDCILFNYCKNKNISESCMSVKYKYIIGELKQ